MSCVDLGDNVNVLVVANGSDSYKWSVTFLLDRLGMRYRSCENVYQAASEITFVGQNHATDTYQPKRTIVVAGLEEICKDQMRFFEICRNTGKTECICLAREGTTNRTEWIVAIAKAGGTVVVGIAELELKIKQLMKEFCKSSVVKPGLSGEAIGGFGNSLGMSAEGVLSKAELDALLGA